MTDRTTLQRLSAREVETLTKGKYADGGGLWLQVTANGKRSWLMRYTLNGKRREMGMGPAGKAHVGLAAARQNAVEVRALVAAGDDPISVVQEKAAKAAGSITFLQYAGKYLDWKLPQLSNAKHQANWRRFIDQYCLSLHKKPMDSITRRDVLAVLQPIWDEKPETGSRGRGMLENVFDHAIQNGAFEGDNPARWSLFNATLSPPKKGSTRGPMASMPRAQLPEFINELRDRSGMAALALEFCILTASRSGEVRFAVWSEINIDGDKPNWTIPSSRMKIKDRAGKPYEHVIPLTPRMLEVLRLAKAQGFDEGVGSDLVFPSRQRGKVLSDATLRAVLHRMNLKQFTVHGFRSTFRDWAGSDTNYPRELAEEALAHLVTGVEASYRREQAVEKRRAMMTDWETFCSEK